jgi:hypothetical protein
MPLARVADSPVRRQVTGAAVATRPDRPPRRAAGRRQAPRPQRHTLRGYDAIQLAAALDARRAGGDVEFASFDARLNRAAQRERLRIAEL